MLLLLLLLTKEVKNKKRGGTTMATPIAPTPVLKGREAVEFQKRLESDLKRPVSLVETPKIRKARELIKQYASKHTK